MEQGNILKKNKTMTDTEKLKWLLGGLDTRAGILEKATSPEAAFAACLMRLLLRNYKDEFPEAAEPRPLIPNKPGWWWLGDKGCACTDWYAVRVKTGEQGWLVAEYNGGVYTVRRLLDSGLEWGGPCLPPQMSGESAEASA